MAVPQHSWSETEPISLASRSSLTQANVVGWKHSLPPEENPSYLVYSVFCVCVLLCYTFLHIWHFLLLEKVAFCGSI